MGKVSPFDFVTLWDVVIVLLFIMFRMAISINKQYSNRGKKEFDINLYFDFEHVIRWMLHIVTAFCMILVLPQLFVSYLGPKYMEGFDLWTFCGSALIGYLGYDIIKYIQIIFKTILSKFGISLTKKVDK